MACCTGSEIDLKEMKTAGQKRMGNVLGPLIEAGMSQGATPFGGQLSQPYDPAQMAAMQVMYGIGKGGGQYTPNTYPLGGFQGYSGGPMSPWNFDDNGGGGDDDNGGGGDYDGDIIEKEKLKAPDPSKRTNPWDMMDREERRDAYRTRREERPRGKFKGKQPSGPPSWYDRLNLPIGVTPVPGYTGNKRQRP